MPRKKIIPIFIAVVVILLLSGGGWYFFYYTKPHVQAVQNTNQDQVIKKLSAQDLGLTLSSSSNKQQIQFTIGNLSGIQAVEYQATYEADSTAAEIAEGGNPRVDRGITGEANLGSGSSNYTSPWLDLGSCSSGTCHYDTGVTSVDLTLKITKNDGSIYQAEQSLSLK